MLLRNAFTLTTPCLALFLLACNDKGIYQPQEAPSQAATQTSPSTAQPVPAPTEAAKPSASILNDAKATHHHHVYRAVHHKHAAPAITESATSAAPAEVAPTPAAATVTVPNGTVLTVRLAQDLGSKTSKAGDGFTATVAEAIMVDGKPLIPEGSTVSGKVTEATPMGMLHKGVLQVTLNSINLNGQDQTIQTSTVSELDKSESEHTGDLAENAGAMAAPATSMAAPAGGLAGAGRGSSLAGAGAGSSLAGAGLKSEVEAKAGTVVAAITGSKDLVFPAQAAMKFTLQQNLDIKP